MKTAAKQHRKLSKQLRKLTEQHASLRTSVGAATNRSCPSTDGSAAAAGSQSLQDMCFSTQQTYFDMSKVMRLQGELAG